MDFITNYFVSLILDSCARDVEKNLYEQGVKAEVIIKVKDVDINKMRKWQQDNQQQPKKEEPKTNEPIIRVLDDTEV